MLVQAAKEFEDKVAKPVAEYTQVSFRPSCVSAMIFLIPFLLTKTCVNALTAYLSGIALITEYSR